MTPPTDKELEEARFELFLSKQRLLRQAAVDALDKEQLWQRSK